jgi:hypothetical protein
MGYVMLRNFMISQWIAKLAVSFFQEFVVNVGKIAAIVNGVTQESKEAIEDVKRNIHAPMADMRIIVRRDATDIQVYRVLVKRDELFFFSG